jgi:hypothetical protein
MRSRKGQVTGTAMTAAAVVSTLLVAACSASAPGASTRYARDLAYAQCMRTHGEPTWPNPSSNGGFMFSASNPLDESSPGYHSAIRACRKLDPDPGGLTEAQVQAGLARLLKFSDCMRAHGVLDFPDPQTTDQGGQMGVAIVMPADGTVDQQSPQYQAAAKACQTLMLVPASGGQS